MDVFYCMVHRSVVVGVCLLWLLCLLCLFSVGNDLSCPPHLPFLPSSAPVSSLPPLTLITLTGLSCVSLSLLPFFLSQTLLWNCPPYVHLMLGLLDCLLVCTVLLVLCPSLESRLTFVTGSVQRVLKTRIVCSTLNGEFKCYSSNLSTDVLPTKRC